MNSAEIEQIRREFLERLRARRVTLEFENAIGFRFRDFSDALRNNDIRSLLRAITVIHHLVLSAAGNEDAEVLCDRLQRLIPTGIKSATQPLACNKLFFIWIGSIGVRSLRNILVWKQANPRYSVQLWFDSHCLLASHYSRVLGDRESLNVSTNGDLIEFQNNAYADIVSMIAGGRTFDEALIELFLRIGDGSIGRSLERELEKAERLYLTLANHLTLYDVQDHAAAIMDDEFRSYYFREIALRGNLAAASDILRLHVIQHFGGVYIDCDTLPSLDHVFVKTCAYCRQHNISFGFVDVLKSELYMQKIEPFIELRELADESRAEAHGRQSDLQAITDHLRSHYAEIVVLAEHDVEVLASENFFKPLGEIRLFKEGLLLTGDPHNRNCFNNNIVIANPRSKVVRIILLEMRHRYRYLDRMGAINTASEDESNGVDSYKSRLLSYRLDALEQKHNVTVLLTGPGLIFEVVLGLGFNLLKLDDDVSPLSLAYALYSPKIGIAFMEQTFHTYDHSRSTWMRGPDGSALTV